MLTLTENEAQNGKPKFRIGSPKLYPILCGMPEFTAWKNMVQRCTNPRNPSYHRYGAKGVRICEEWRIFEKFLADVGNRPGPGYSIDRHPDKNGNYEPGNVRWATASQQSRNRRNSVMATIHGQTRTVPDWCELLKMNYGTVMKRIYRHGLTPELALTLKTHAGKKWELYT